MTQDEIKEVKLFGFKLNIPAASIIFYLILPFTLNFIPMLVSYGFTLRNVSITELISDFRSVLYITLYFVMPIFLIPLFIYILITCLKIQKHSRGQENNRVRWLGFQLSKTAHMVIFILSIVNLILVTRALVINSINLAFFLDRPYIYAEIISQYVAGIIIQLILTNLHIYSLVVCAKNRNIVR